MRSLQAALLSLSMLTGVGCTHTVVRDGKPTTETNTAAVIVGGLGAVAIILGIAFVNVVNRP